MIAYHPVRLMPLSPRLLSPWICRTRCPSPSTVCKDGTVCLSEHGNYPKLWDGWLIWYVGLCCCWDMWCWLKCRLPCHILPWQQCCFFFPLAARWREAIWVSHPLIGPCNGNNTSRLLHCGIWHHCHHLCVSLDHTRTQTFHWTRRNYHYMKGIIDSG